MRSLIVIGLVPTLQVFEVFEIIDSILSVWRQDLIKRTAVNRHYSLWQSQFWLSLCCIMLAMCTVIRSAAC